MVEKHLTVNEWQYVEHFAYVGFSPEPRRKRAKAYRVIR
jgi:hypothetical protein